MSALRHLRYVRRNVPVSRIYCTECDMSHSVYDMICPRCAMWIDYGHADDRLAEHMSRLLNAWRLAPPAARIDLEAVLSDLDSAWLARGVP